MNREGPPNDVDIAWLTLGHLDAADAEAVRAARDRTLARLRDELPGFDWHMPLLSRRDLRQAEREESVGYIELGIEERDTGHRDLVLVVTGADLIAHRNPTACLGASSRGAAVGVLSTARIDPHARGEEVDHDTRVERMAQRLGAMALHIIGDLVGVPHDRAAGSAMTPIDSIDVLDGIDGYTDQTRAAFEPELRRIADLRLEETRRPPRRLWFYLRAARMNTAAIAGSCWRARPWELPFRMGRLSAAAVSALVVLLIAAESWEVALRASPATLAGLSALSLAGTVAYAVRRQHLLMSRPTARLTEQIVVADMSVVITVGIGLSVAYAILFALTLAAAGALFPPGLIATWARLREVGTEHYARIASFAASIGLAIGALGASFESRSFFRHVTYVDEELG